jgi:hypothetical protein
MSAFDAFWHLDMRHLHNTNNALMVLLPKIAEAKAIKDYRPIALIHSIDKLIAKALANRLAPRLQELVHVSQNAFIEGRFIHNSFKLNLGQAPARKEGSQPSAQSGHSPSIRLSFMVIPFADHASCRLL